MPTVPGIEADDANSNDIKQEISRFESVHPAIYAMYDLIESLADRRQAEMFRRQVASVEDAFVNSQEWTLGHTVPQIKLGLLGSVNSGKSALVHRYLTGTYLKDESPEGGRFKKEVVLDGQSYLLLIRDEGGPPDEQFSRWIDGAVFVFSLDSEESFRVVCDYYERLDTFRETHDLPIILVGTQDSTSDSNPRVIDDAKARRLANSLNKCPYFETCSTYGLNVERVFQDACYKIVQSRPDLSYLLSANVAPHLQRAQQFQMFQQQQQRSQPVYPIQPAYPMQPHVPAASYRDRMMPSMSQVHSATMSGVDANLASCMNAQMSMQCMHANTTARGGSYQHRLPPLPVDNGTNGTTMGSQPSGDTRHSDMHNNPGFEPDFGDQAISRPCSFLQPLRVDENGAGGSSTLSRTITPVVLAPPPPSSSSAQSETSYWGIHPFIGRGGCDNGEEAQWYATSHASCTDVSRHGDYLPLYFIPLQLEPRLGGTDGEAKDSLTPNSTPTQSRKTRPKSNLFRKTDDNREKEKKVIDGIGSGRSIPIKQGYLYKRTCKPLNKEWKTKKYVALTDDARLIYHPSIQDYVQNAHGKEIDLSRVTVKIPGVNFRQTGGQQVNSCSSTAVAAAAASNSSSNNNGGGGARSQGDVSGSDKLSTSLENTAGGGGGGVLDGTQSPSEGIINTGNRLMSQQGSKETSKKRYRRVKSTQKTGATDGYESEGYEFQLISMDRAWNFEAHSAEERDEWVSHIDRAIITRLQLLESSNSSNSRQQQQQQGGHSLHPHFHPHHQQQNQSGHHQEASGNSGSGGGGGWGGGHGTTGSDPGAAAAGGGGRGGGGGGSGGVDEAMAKSLRAVAGNDACADCGAPDPDWASLNLGELVCIECSGVHRRLGTHISRVRSLLLDDWTPEAAAVMRAIGNTLANSVWEAAVPANLNSRRKPDSRSSKEEMEAWIRAKYEQREFLPPLPYPEAPLQQQLIDAIARQDTRQVVLCLARATPETVNAPYSRQDSRAAIHIAATLGNIVYLQLLLWYNGDPKVVDSEGRNAFYYAHCSCHFDCANFLARNGCPRQTVPAPALAHFAAASQQQQQQQALPPTTKSQQQQQVGMTPKHHSAMAYQQQQQQPQPPTPQQQQQQMVMGYRGGPGVPQPQQQLPPPTPQAAAGGFAPVFMHNIMPGSAGNHPMHGTMGGGGGGLASGATVAAGATLPRRRGPFGPPAATAGGAGGMYLPSQPIPTSSTTVANSMANRPLPVAGAFDPSTMAGATNQAQNAKPGDPPEISI